MHAIYLKKKKVFDCLAPADGTLTKSFVCHKWKFSVLYRNARFTGSGHEGEKTKDKLDLLKSDNSYFVFS